jgi:hypothetical protein
VFKEGVSDCPECGTPLLPGTAEGETADFVEVFKASSLIEAEAITAALDEAGIENLMRGTTIPSVPLMGESAMIPIEVRVDQAEAAKKIIEDLETAPPPEIDENAGSA